MTKTHNSTVDISQTGANLDSTRPVGGVRYVAVVLAADGKVCTVADLHEAAAVLTETLGTHSGARLTGDQLDAISNVNDTVGRTGDNADEGSESGCVLHFDVMAADY